MRLTVVRVFALRIGVMHHDAQAAGAPACGRPLQHLKIAVGVAEGGDRAATDMLLDADGFAGLVVDEVRPAGRRNRMGLPSRISNFVTMR